MKEKHAGRIFKKMARHVFGEAFLLPFFYFTWRKLYLHMIG